MSTTTCFYGEIRKKLALFKLEKKGLIWSYEVRKLWLHGTGGIKLALIQILSSDSQTHYWRGFQIT